MTIDEAIEQLEMDQDDILGRFGTRRYDALKLGIEALKEIHRERIGEIPFIGEQLPGETEGEKNETT